MGHESYERPDITEGSSNRSFGIIFAILFAVVGLLPLYSGSSVRSWSLVTCTVFLLCALFLPSVLAPLNRAWSWFGLQLHKIVSPIVLGIMFFLVITPIGLAMRAFGKDPLRLKFDKVSNSYWIERMPPGPLPESFKDQF
jgi:hypothetical protein